MLITSWHASQIEKEEARREWKLLVRHELFEMRACPLCGLPVLRWRTFDEIRTRTLRASLRAARGNLSMAARRLGVGRQFFYEHVPNLPVKRPGRVGNNGGRKKEEGTP
jgi:transcriptional regulator of acetoin/glycerol metabolism